MKKILVLLAVVIAVCAALLLKPKKANAEEYPYTIPCGYDYGDGSVKCPIRVQIPYVHCTLHGGKSLQPIQP